MADISDVESALVTIAGSVLYPSGVSSPSDVSPISGCVVCTVRGWPTSQELDSVLEAGNALVTVYPIPNMSQTTTRFSQEWVTVPQDAPILTVTTYGNTATFSGAGANGVVAGVRYNRAAYSVHVAEADTPATIAAGIATQIAGASSSGGILTVPESLDFVARIGAEQKAILEVERLKDVIDITIWAPTPEIRDAIGRAIRPALREQFVAMPDSLAETGREFIRRQDVESHSVRPAHAGVR
jgi:hypothetical protein